MKINYPRLLLVLCLILLCVLGVEYFRFDYLGYLSPEATVSSTPTETVIVFAPKRPNISAVVIFVETSFYPRNANNTSVKFVAKIIEDKINEQERIMDSQTLPLSVFPYKGFKKIYLSKPIHNPELKKVSFSFDSGQVMVDGGLFKIVEVDTGISVKNETPRIMYQDSIGDITREARDRFFEYKVFAYTYVAITALIGLMLTSLFVFSFRNSAEN